MGYPSFNVGDVLTASDMNAVGLWQITPTVSGTGMSVSGNEVILTNVTNGEIRSVFSSTYRHYRVILTHNCSTTLNVAMQMLSGTNTPETGSVYRYAATGWMSGNITYTDFSAANTQLTGFSGGGSTDAGSAYVIADFLNPNIASRTWIKSSNAFEWVNNEVYMRDYGNFIDTATQYTGFRLVPNTGNISGVLRIYGYKN